MTNQWTKKRTEPRGTYSEDLKNRRSIETVGWGDSHVSFTIVCHDCNRCIVIEGARLTDGRLLELKLGGCGCTAITEETQNGS